jgi:hypothetical protein
MKKIISVLAASFLIYGCGDSTDADAEKDNQKEKAISDMEIELVLTDSLVLQTKDLQMAITDYHHYISTMANKQMTAEDVIRQKLEESENKAKILVEEILKRSKAEIKENAKMLNHYLDSTFMIGNQIKELLPDFASYEDAVNAFTAKVMTDIDGEFELRTQKLMKEVMHLEEKLHIEKEKLMLKLEKAKR